MKFIEYATKKVLENIEKIDFYICYMAPGFLVNKPRPADKQNPLQAKALQLRPAFF
jgi:hypothetical protein